MDRSLPLAINCEPALTPEMIEGLEAFFAGADDRSRRMAIREIDRAVQLYRAEKENPFNPLGAARQITRIKTALDLLTKEICTLTPTAVDALCVAAQDNEWGGFNLWNYHQEIGGQRFVDVLCGAATLCRKTLETLPEVDKEGKARRGRPPGTTANHDKVLAEGIINAFHAAFHRPPTRLYGDVTEVDKIYEVIKMGQAKGSALQAIKKGLEIK